MTQIAGKNLQIGDTIEVWWQPRRDTVVALRPYTGPLAYLWPAGARIVIFAILRSGMTIGNGDVLTKIA